MGKKGIESPVAQAWSDTANTIGHLRDAGAGLGGAIGDLFGAIGDGIRQYQNEKRIAAEAAALRYEDGARYARESNLEIAARAYAMMIRDLLDRLRTKHRDVISDEVTKAPALKYFQEIVRYSNATIRLAHAPHETFYGQLTNWRKNLYDFHDSWAERGARQPRFLDFLDTKADLAKLKASNVAPEGPGTTHPDVKLWIPEDMGI
ncbi:MAG: hypothetical protein M0Z85_04590 [Gammaproteobacteria bacterium]|nr:hypothetical protein [Gammaproteobacteria bacterium]